MNANPTFKPLRLMTLPLILFGLTIIWGFLTRDTAPSSPLADGPYRVGIQIGHEAIAQVPDELSWLRMATGASWNGLSEAAVNRAIAEALRNRLEAAGVTVDLLPATVPVSYQAHAFISIHADGSEGTLRGWKVSPPRRPTAASQLLAEAIIRNYAVIDMPYHANGITRNMLDYYAFPGYGVRHSVAEITPSVIMETGFLSSAEDRLIIVEQPQLVADALAAGILEFLEQTDFTDGSLFTR